MTRHATAFLRRLPVLLAAVFLISACAGDVISVTGDPFTQDDPGLKNPDLSWSAAEFEAVLGSENSFPVLSNRFDVAVDYTSSSDRVATIAADGTKFVAAFKPPLYAKKMVVCAPSLSQTCFKAVSVSGETFCEGCWAMDGISGGTAVTLTPHNSNAWSTTWP